LTFLRIFWNYKGLTLARAKNHKYGLRAAVYGGSVAAGVAKELLGCDYHHPVPAHLWEVRYGGV